MNSSQQPADNPLLPLLRRSLKLFLILASIYGLLFLLDSRIRKRKGPWSVKFEKLSGNELVLTIDHPALGVRTNVLRFYGQALTQYTNLSNTITFTTPDQKLPFGELVFTDLTFLPGVVTMQIEGHEIELLPRTLLINRKETPWNSFHSVELKEEDRPRVGLARPQKRKVLGREKVER